LLATLHTGFVVDVQPVLVFAKAIFVGGVLCLHFEEVVAVQTAELAEVHD